jgi:hypothetical protein
MTDPITPPPELIGRWEEDWHHSKVKHIELEDHIATQAAQWGADQELEACCEWFSADVVSEVIDVVSELRAARRPKPPSLKEQALKMLRPLSNPVMPGTPEYRLYEPQAEIIRRALEALDD